VEILSVGSRGHTEIFSYPELVMLWRGLVACDLLIRAKCQLRPYAADPAEVDRVFDSAFPEMAAMLEEDRLDLALKVTGVKLHGIECLEGPRKPVVGVAGDIYTRIHPYGNDNLFERLEKLGLEVWPAPFLVDSVDFILRRAFSDALYEGNYRDAAGGAFLYMRNRMEAWRVRFHLGTRLERVEEPGYQETLDLAGPYVDGKVNEILLQNVAKMVDYAKRGADGVINAISFHCMLGTICAALTERIRMDYDMMPISTFIYSGKSGGEVETRLEAFAHQVKTYHERRWDSREPESPVRGWLTGWLND